MSEDAEILAAVDTLHDLVHKAVETSVEVPLSRLDNHRKAAEACQLLANSLFARIESKLWPDDPVRLLRRSKP